MGSFAECISRRHGDGARGGADARWRALEVSFEPMESGGSVVLVEDVTERKDAEARIRQLARYDPLTGLPNRNLLHEQMEAMLGTARRGRQLYGVLFIDLDRFKQVNDTLGHAFGDRLLCAVSDRRRTLVREPDLIARFGGDEFVVILAAIQAEDDAAAIAERIVGALADSDEPDRRSSTATAAASSAAPSGR